jgi:hypothetical protein
MTASFLLLFLVIMLTGPSSFFLTSNDKCDGTPWDNNVASTVKSIWKLNQAHISNEVQPKQLSVFRG